MSRDSAQTWALRVWWTLVGLFLVQDLWRATWRPHPVREFFAVAWRWAQGSLWWLAFLYLLPAVVLWVVTDATLRLRARRLRLPPPTLRETWAEFRRREP